MLERSDPFYSPKTLILGAETAVNNLREAIDRFMSNDPFRTKIAPNDDGSWLEQKIVLDYPIPPEIETYARQIIGDSRHALDQAMYVVCGNEQTYFPIGKSEQDFENAVKGRAKKCPARIVDIIREFKPYYDYDGTRDGNYLIWGLNRLCNESKHSIIVPVPLNLGKKIWEYVYIPPNSGPLQLGIASDWNWDKGEMVVNRFHPSSKVEFRAHFEVGFNVKSEYARMNHPAKDILSSMFYVARGIVSSIEKEFVA